MYNATTIKTQFINLVGWRQNVEATGFQLTAPLSTAPTSGMYFNDFHPMLNFDNLVSVAPNFAELTFNAWDGSTFYVVGDVVTHNGENFICIQDHFFGEPPDVNYWDLFNEASLFNTWLKEKTEAGIIGAVEDWLSAKVRAFTGNNLLFADTMFKVSNNIANTQTNAGKIVGFEIVPTRSDNVIVKVEQIGVQFDTNQTVTINLFKSGTVAPVDTVDVVYTGNGGVQWEVVNWELDGEGAYFIAYNEDDVTGNAINGASDFTAFSSGSTKYPAARFFGATAFAIDDDDDSQLWDLADNEYTHDTNFGLNFKVSVRCDYTDFLVAQKAIFQTVIGLRVAMDVLRELTYNPASRVNRFVDNVSTNHLLYELDGDAQGRDDFSLLGKYKAALDAVQFDTTGICDVCLPHKRRGVRFKAIGP